MVIIARDLAQLSSRESLEILANGGYAALAAAPFDDVATLGAASSPFLKAAFSGWRKALGREWVQGGAALASYVGGRLLDHPKMTAVGGDLIGRNSSRRR